MSEKKTYIEFENEMIYLEQQLKGGAYGIPEKGDYIHHMILRLISAYPNYYEKYKNK